MGKKCIPGVFCIENMTLFLLFFIIVVLIYMYYNHTTKVIIVSKHLGESEPSSSKTSSSSNTSPPLSLSPPTSNLYSDRIPVNIESRGPSPNFGQVGILTKPNENLILPLMGRRLSSGRDKYQYFTYSNTGNINTKLPISKAGKSCTGEYGCDEVFNGDMVFVEGYADTFKATIYENSTFAYIP
jgi:hypothetical protein